MLAVFDNCRNYNCFRTTVESNNISYIIKNNITKNSNDCFRTNVLIGEIAWSWFTPWRGLHLVKNNKTGP